MHVEPGINPLLSDFLILISQYTAENTELRNTTIKRSRGCPKGSKNKHSATTLVTTNNPSTTEIHQGPGRPRKQAVRSITQVQTVVCK